MFRKTAVLTILAGTLMLALSACNLVTQGPLPPATQDINTISTQAAQTVVAQLTNSAAQASPTPQAPTATATNTLPPTATPTATLPPTATATLPPTATPTQAIPCDAAQFVADVTIPDGTIYTAGTSFVKTWRLRNIGSCTWTTGYQLVFVDGERMNGRREINLDRAVRPGETIDVSVDLQAPDKAGSYRGNWMLRNASGRTFGIGGSADGKFWVSIQVSTANTDFFYDFAANLCRAEWRSDVGRLPCPGSVKDEGYIQLLSRPALENGTIEDEPGLLAVPEYTDAGYIIGVYPQITVPSGSKLRVGIGCQHNAKDCEVTFEIAYRDENGVRVSLGSWREVNDNQINIIEIDLASLAGKKVQFLFEVYAGESSRGDLPIWWVPHITKPVQ